MPNNLFSMNETKICRLCLVEILEDSFESLDNIKTRMLKILPLNLDVAVSKDPIMCPNCVRNLQSSFEFKTSCLSNNDYLKTYLGSSDITLNLEEIIVKKLNLGIKREEESVCRFCLDYFDRNEFIEMNSIEQGMLVKCLPEIDLNITENPLICNNCMQLLQNQFKFMTSCADNEEKISNFYSKDENMSLKGIMKQIKSMKKDEDVYVQEQNIKIEKNDEYLYDNLIKIEKEQFEEVNDDSFYVKIEDIGVDQEYKETEKERTSRMANPNTEGPLGSGNTEDDELTLPRASINKMIKELVPSIRIANEARELIWNCCTEFIHLLSSESNDICNQLHKQTINAEHVLMALDKLGFGDYHAEAEAVIKDCKSAKRRRRSTRLENLGIPEEELLRQQQELFAKARQEQAYADQQQWEQLQAAAQQAQASAVPSTDDQDDYA